MPVADTCQEHQEPPKSCHHYLVVDRWLVDQGSLIEGWSCFWLIRVGLVPSTVATPTPSYQYQGGLYITQTYELFLSVG